MVGTTIMSNPIAPLNLPEVEVETVVLQHENNEQDNVKQLQHLNQQIN